MITESLAAELEKLLTLNELTELCRASLGVDPETIGGTAAKASFARALVQRCLKQDAVPALLDAVEATGKRLSEPLKKLRVDGLALEAELGPGVELGDFLIVGELGAGPTARVYRARREGEDVRLRVLHGSALRRRDAERALVQARLAGNISHAGLPDGVQTAALDFAGQTLLTISHDFVAGESLAQVLAKAGGRHLNAVLPMLWALAEPLATLHAEGRAHGAVHPGNVILTDVTQASPKVRLLDAGAGFARPPLSDPGEQRWVSYLAPELLRGQAPTPSSDVYAFGVLFYELISGKPPFVGDSAADVALGHLIESPEPLSFVAPGNGASPAVETLVRTLLEKKPDQRPRDATELLEGLRKLWHASQRPPSFITDDRIPELFASFAKDPDDDEEAAKLESMIDLGASPALLADGFFALAKELREKDEQGTRRVVPRLLARAARLYEKASQHESAEKLYKGLLQLEPDNRATAKALDKVRRALGKHEELVESLLERSEAASNDSERAEYLFAIGEVYASDVDDKDQALVAYTQAFCADPTVDTYAEAIERLAGTRYQSWEEVLGLCLEAANGELSTDAQHDMFQHLARWYAEKVARPDLALPWLQRVLEIEPSHERSLEMLAQIYRKAQQWAELSQVLVKRADVAAPNVARDLRAEAAEIVASKLGNAQAALELLESVVAEDPGHEQAVKAMVEQLRQQGDLKRALGVLSRRAATLSGEERHELLCEVAEGYEVEADDLEAGEKIYKQVAAEDPKSSDALRGLDRIYSRQSRYQELLPVLEREVELAVTARQKITLLERVAGVWDEEFLDHGKAAAALEQVIALDPLRVDAARELSRHYRSLEKFVELAELYQTQIDKSSDDKVRLDAALALGRVLGTELSAPQRAIEAYELVLSLEPGHKGALDALATLRATAGDSESALDAIEELAGAAKTPKERAEQYLRASALLEQRGDLEASIAQLKRAIDAAPEDGSARAKLKSKYTAMGNYAGVVDLLEEELDNAKGEHQRAKLAGQIAVLCQRHLQDTERASSLAQLAFHLDPMEPGALRVLGRLAYDDGRFMEAAKRLEPVISVLEGMETNEAADVARLYIEALVKGGSAEKAMVMVEGLRRFFADDARALLAVAELASKNDAPEQAYALAQDLLQRLGPSLGLGDSAKAERLRGEALIGLGRHDEGISALERALDTDARDLSPLDAIAAAHSKLGRYDQALETLYRKLERTVGEDRAKLLLQIGDLAATRLKNADYAAKSYLLALSEKPNDRDILTKLMQLYGTEKDWPSLISVITKLAEVVTEKKHKAKYLHTASMIASRELQDGALAQQLLEQSLELDPSAIAALDEALSLRQKARDWEGVKNLLKLRVTHAQDVGDTELLLTTLWQLADVYERHLKRLEQAIAVCREAHQVEPENTRWAERLARLYADDAAGSFAESVPLLGEWIDRDPYQSEPYQLLRRIYTGVRHADGAWSACQALHALGRAEPDEERFYARMRNEEPVTAADSLALTDWPEYILPSEHDPALTALMALLEPLVLAARGKGLEQLGLTTEHLLSSATYPYGLVQAIKSAADTLGLSEPPIFQNQGDPGVLTFLATKPASIALGAGAFASELPLVTSTFVAGRAVAYFVPGFFLRQVLSNMTALKSWVFAAIRLVKPKFPVAAELEPLVAEAQRELSSAPMPVAQREQLTDVVSKLLRSTESLDLKKWAHSVDHAADRAGLVMCQDLEHAVSLIKAIPAEEGAPPANQRIEKLITYSISTAHLTLREKLGTGVGG
ncbi:MAG: protein kinase [Polyangiaceae bacterium]|jgi:tetratricopeptide (TPR) repeat protein|nr:protein kinase [Polyangiaceae bacterium]